MTIFLCKNIKGQIKNISSPRPDQHRVHAPCEQQGPTGDRLHRGGLRARHRAAPGPGGCGRGAAGREVHHDLHRPVPPQISRGVRGEGEFLEV